MKAIKLSALLFMLVISAEAQTANYDVSLIAKTLLPYASAVVRQSELTTEVKDMSNTIIHTKQAVTILNKNGDSNADIIVWHNKSNQIRYIRGMVYDQYGKLQSKFSEKDFQDYSAGSNSSLFEDSRVKHYKPEVTEYPYTVEYEYEVRSRQTLNFSDWQPNPSYGTAVENSVCRFITKPDFTIRYTELNYPGKAEVIRNADNTITRQWKISNLKAVKAEPYSPDEDQYLTIVRFAPEKFYYDGHAGSFANWNELGKWIYTDLLSTRTQLPPETVSQMQDMVKGITNEKLKAKKIYEYMQQKTRYVSVQIGIGGYQPFQAADVDRQSYGDCKALVNYTQALLKAVNISSYYCVVQAGSRKESLMPDFASMEQGNHIILCLPFKNDTTWLECTSKQIPFGYLGTFTDDRNVLACTPQGGKIMHTPKYTAAENRQTCHAVFAINNDGVLDGEVKTTFEGTQYDNCDDLVDEAYADQIKAVKKLYGIDNMDIEHLELMQDKKVHPVIIEAIKLKADGYAANNAGKIYFYANATNRVHGAPREVHNRVTSVYINRGYTDVDEIVYTVPEGYVLDSFPMAVDLSKPFGTYSAHLKQEGNQLIYKRRIQINDGTYSKDTYQDLVDFYDAVAEADNRNVALVKK